MAELPLFIVSFMYAFLATEALYPNGTCDRDSDCLDPVGYHCCKGTTWCCPDEYICTATKTCISNIGLGLQDGKIVGICFGLLFAVSGGSCCYYLKKKSKGNTDADCHSLVIANLFCCIGTEWCCPYGYDCTGTSTCKGIRWQEIDGTFGDDSNKRERGLGTLVNL
uniref:Granulin n=1 Tax=Magallana gigas TaxID=29159 RepID=A0A8W8IGV2_MAGGI